MTSRSSTDSRVIVSMRDMSMLTPPCSAAMWPSSDEPAPKGIIGVPCRAQVRTITTASSTVSGKATASGGAGG